MGLISWIPLNEEKITDHAFGEVETNLTSNDFNALGKIGPGYSLYFNTLTSKNVYLNDKFSITFWIYNDFIKDGVIFEMSNWSLYYFAGDYLYFNGEKLIETEFLVDSWNHISFIYNNGNNQFYINNHLIHEFTLNVNTKEEDIKFGGFQGIIQDIRVYDHALSKKEIKDIYHARIIHYNFEDIENNTAFGISDKISDCSGYNNNADVNNIDVSVEAILGKQSLNISGSNSYIEFINPKDDFFTTDYTINFWVKLTKNSTYNNILLFENNAGKTISLFKDINNYLYFINEKVDFGIIPINEWIMLSIVGTNDSAEIYLNAESRGDRPTQLSNGYIYWQIGQDNLGLISDFSVYATKLSIEDIKTLYNSKAQITKNGILNADFFEEIEGNVKLPKNTSVVEATEFNENSDKVRVMKTNSVEAFSFNEWN